MILVSACLLGLNTRYDGVSNKNPLLMEYALYGKFHPICPEQLGGLSTPRTPAEIVGGEGIDVINGSAKVLSYDKEDITESFINGSEEVLKLIRTMPITAVILKEKSPSCGVHFIYNGDFNSIKKSGSGVTAAALKNLDVPVYSENEITRELMEELLAR